MTLNRAICGRLALLALLAMSFQHAVSAADDDEGDPERLRMALFAAAADSDEARLDTLYNRHHATIVENFSSWRKGPIALGADPAAARRYDESLRAIARHFARRGDRTLIGVLEGTAERAKMLGWMRSYNDARVLLGKDQCEKVIAILDPVADEMNDWMGGSVEALAQRVRGTLGSCHTRLQDFDAALKWTYSAYELSVKNEDSEGIITYSGNMAAIYRTMGDEKRFHDWLDATVGLMESAGREAEASALRAEHRLYD
jgi:hypothetical protein